MTPEIVSNTYANFGLFGLIVVAFFSLVYYEVKSNEKREQKLHHIIDTLASELPEIRKSLEEIKSKVMRS
jgi:hypothetical protein